MTTELRRALERVAKRFRHALALVGAGRVLAGVGAGRRRPLAGRARSGEPLIPTGWLLALFVVAVATGACLRVAALRSLRDARWVARKIEARHPELTTGLLAAVEEEAAAPAGRLGFLQSAVVREALDHRRSHDWDETVADLAPPRLSAGPRGDSGLLDRRGHRALQPGALAARRPRSGAPRRRRGAGDVEVDPGNTEIERGRLAPGRRPVQGGRAGRRQPGRRSTRTRRATRRGMTRSLEDPTFAGHVESVDADLAYRVEFQGKSSETYHVHVFEYPELERTDARLVFPGYTAPRAQDRRRHPPRHGRRGNRADPAVPAEQRRRHRTTGRRRRAGDRAGSSKRRQARVPSDPHAGRSPALQGQARRPRRANQQAGDRDRRQRDAQPACRSSR